MSVKLVSITMNTAHLSEQIEFYKALGFGVEAVKISKGSECYRAWPLADNSKNPEAVGFEIKLFSVLGKSNPETPVFQLCFSVQSLDSVYNLVTKVRGTMTLLDPTDMPDGRKAIIKDPDGNSIEIIEVKS